MTLTRTCNLFVLMIGIVLLTGCDEKDHYKEAAQVAEKAADRQAQQNTEMAQLNREIAEGTRRLVEADAETRKDIVAVHRELQAERVELISGFTELEAERKQIAQERQTESILAPVIRGAGVTLVAVLVLGFCWALVFGMRGNQPSDAELNELLIKDMVRDRPLLLSNSPPPAIEDQLGNTNQSTTEGGTH